MNKLLIISIIAIIFVIAGFYLLSNSSITGNVIADNSKDENTKTVDQDEESKDVKTFVLTGSHLRFYINDIENPVIRVKEGEKVKIVFTSTEGFHDWKIDDLNAATEKVNAGGTSSVEFITDKKGTFEYYCSVGKHRENGMKGVLVVE